MVLDFVGLTLAIASFASVLCVCLYVLQLQKFYRDQRVFNLARRADRRSNRRSSWFCLPGRQHALAALCWIAVLSHAGAAHAAASGPYKIVTIAYPGFVEPTLTGVKLGLGVELARAAFAAVDVEVEFELLPVARLMREMEVGKHSLMMGGIWYYPEDVRKNLQLVPLLRSENVVFYSSKHFDPGAQPIAGILRSARIATTFAPESVRKSELTVVVVPEAKDVVRMVMEGREKLGVLPLTAVYSLFRELYPSRLSEMKVLPQIISSAYSGVAFDTRDPQLRALAKKFQRGKNTIEETGKADLIRRKYLPDAALVAQLRAIKPMFDHRKR